MRRRLVFATLSVATVVLLSTAPVHGQTTLPAASPALRSAGCAGRGVSYPLDYYLPIFWGGWVIVSDERRNAEQLAATFADPADALARLRAWCWAGQAERVYVKDGLTIDVSMHDFLAAHDVDAAAQAQAWFGEQRARDVGLTRDDTTREELETDLGEGGQVPVNIEALDTLIIDAYANDTEYTLYARRAPVRTQTGGRILADKVVRVTASGESPVRGRSRASEAYRALAHTFCLDLIPSQSERPGTAADCRGSGVGSG
ncbi:MAG: hypothetical protein K0S78_3314 [Thermomicrobiales bacterium]|jgi:hypothetical protein|nr:hypothetical protein [Thermomicrobiales bacterium]